MKPIHRKLLPLALIGLTFVTLTLRSEKAAPQAQIPPEILILSAQTVYYEIDNGESQHCFGPNGWGLINFDISANYTGTAPLYRDWYGPCNTNTQPLLAETLSKVIGQGYRIINVLGTGAGMVYTLQRP